MTATVSPLLTIDQAAKVLVLSTKTVRTLTKNGKIPCIRIGHSVRYSSSDLAAFIDRSRTGGTEATQHG